ncbi:MAG TPA: hypothetical protein VNZ86_07790 [Bacteroidia bacterium]|jgi:hypothetical protein|nr:hypothetical protein [Bacteroidia bacterium]
MKHFFLFCSAFFLLFSVTAQNKRFVASMEKNIKMMDTCKSVSGYQQTSNAFERIANAEKKEWLPPYYTALCHIFMATMQTGDKIDEYCDIAERYVNKADSLSPNNSEVYALKALLYSSRIGVNPMMRGAKFGGMSGEMSAKAKELDPANPRPYLLQAQGKYYTPPQFGGGKDKALPLLEEAVKKYDAFKPASTIHPDWGKARAKMLLEDCQKK